MGATPAQQLELAKNILRNQGLAFRIYGPTDIESMLDAYAEDDRDPVDTKVYRKEIVEHIMGGKDWPDLSKKGYDDEQALWMMVEGTRNDHPEWFISNKK